MTTLSEKTVETKENSRIDAEDVRFCQAIQSAYEQTHAMLVRMAREISDYENKQQKILNDSGIQEARFLFFDVFSTNSVFDRLESLPNSFIHKLADYFTHKYDIYINPEEICADLVPQLPAVPKLYSCYASKDQSDFAELKKKDEQAMAEYIVAVKAYEQRARSLVLSYEDVVEQIFVQIGGTSLQQKAVSELKENARKAAWSESRKMCNYEQKKNVVILPAYTSACRVNWSDRFELSGSSRAIFKALSYFESGSTGAGGAFQELLDSDFFDQVHCINGEKVQQVRCYKNGRIDIKFTGETYAQEFVDQYLGTEA